MTPPTSSHKKKKTPHTSHPAPATTTPTPTASTSTPSQASQLPSPATTAGSPFQRTLPYLDIYDLGRLGTTSKTLQEQVQAFIRCVHATSLYFPTPLRPYL